MPDRPTPDTILQEALELVGPEERAAYLDEACGSDAALRDEIESLLAAHFEADAFMDTLADPVWQKTASEKEGDRIGRYKLLQQIGEGGFGTVYLAEQTEPVKRRVALKVIKPGMDSKEVIARFEAERQALALMDHPHIAKVHDAGTTEGGRPYFVMELVKGVPLTNYCADKDLDTKERLELFVDVCAAVQHAHQKGIIHRDLKPSNILVSPHDGKPVVKVIDFGIAKAISMELTDKTVFTQLGRMIGTPQYMSPEQAELNALDVDTRSDIYSLGVVLYELLTGSTPLDGEKIRSAAYGEMQRLIREETPPKPSTRVSTAARQVSTSHPPDSRSLRGDLDWIVMKALEKERERRYETANGLAMDIGRHLRNEPVAAGPPSAGYRFGKFAKRNKAVIGVAAAMGFLLSAGIATTSWQAVRATKARDEAVLAQKDAEAIAEFLTGMFESSRPGEEKGGRDVKVRDILDRAAADLESNTAMAAERRARLQATLGRTYGELGLYDEAIALFDKVYNFCLATRGPEHPDTLNAMKGLAMCYFVAGRRDEGLGMQEEVLALFRKVLGDEHPDTLSAMGILAGSYSDAGRRDEGLEMQEEVLALSRKVLGPEHPSTLGAMHNLAVFYSHAGRRDEGLGMQEELLALRRKVNGPEHSNTLAAMTNLAVSYAYFPISSLYWEQTD